MHSETGRHESSGTARTPGPVGEMFPILSRHLQLNYLGVCCRACCSDRDSRGAACDGDTIDVGRIPIRLNGVSAPEMDWPLGPQSKAFIIDLDA